LHYQHLEHAAQCDEGREGPQTNRRQLRDELASSKGSSRRGAVVEFEFGMKFKIDAADTDSDELVERLGEAGCDDALVGTGLPGRIALEFAREARSVKEAIISALRDVKRAIPSAELIEVTPDFVGLTDVAELVGVSRQNMRKLMLAHSATFPAPVSRHATGRTTVTSRSMPRRTRNLSVRARHST
jgi:hypothetical protein